MKKKIFIQRQERITRQQQNDEIKSKSKRQKFISEHKVKRTLQKESNHKALKASDRNIFMILRSVEKIDVI